MPHTSRGAGRLGEGQAAKPSGEAMQGPATELTALTRENAAAAFQGPGFRGRQFLSALPGLRLGVVSPASEGGPLDNRRPLASRRALKPPTYDRLKSAPSSVALRWRPDPCPKREAL